MGFSRRRLVPALALTAVWALAGSLGCGSDPTTSAYNLSGYVTELGSGDPIRNATVTFTSDTLRRTETSTNGSGFYEMVVETDTPFGQVRAEAEGYDPGESTVYFDAPERRVDLELKRPSPR